MEEKFYVTPNGLASGVGIVPESGWVETTAEEFKATSAAYDAQAKERRATARAAALLRQRTDASTVYQGAKEAGLPDAAALIMARQIYAGFEVD